VRLPDVSERLVAAVDGAARERLVDRFGPAVAGWCDELPGLVGAVTAGWRVRVRRALPPGGTSVLYECVGGDGVPVVLKLTPDRSIAAGEAAGLAAWGDSPHVVRLLDADLGRGGLLLELLSPGVPLSEDPAGWALSDIAPVLAALRSTRPGPIAEVVPPLRDRLAFLFDLTERRRHDRPELRRNLPPELLDRSRSRALALADSGPVGLVHGDLHPGNCCGPDGERSRSIRAPASVIPRSTPSTGSSPTPPTSGTSTGASTGSPTTSRPSTRTGCWPGARRSRCSSPPASCAGTRRTLGHGSSWPSPTAQPPPPRGRRVRHHRTSPEDEAELAKKPQSRVPRRALGAFTMSVAPGHRGRIQGRTQSGCMRVARSCARAYSCRACKARSSAPVRGRARAPTGNVGGRDGAQR
jgi:streptomycin 6-kinase